MVGEGALVGRDRELVEVGSFFAGLEHAPAVAILEGDPGIGKTMLWRAGSELARARSYHILVEAPWADDVRDLLVRSGLVPDRITPAIGDRQPSEETL